MRPARAHRGQMTVEMAVLMPVTIVIALTGYNLARFIQACAAFDRVSLDTVISQGVAPSGDQQETIAVGEVKAELERALSESFGGDSCSVDVSAESMGDLPDAGDGIGFPVSPLLTRFTCTLRYRPWPSSLSIAGARYGPIAELKHERSFVIDRFRPGVVI